MGYLRFPLAGSQQNVLRLHIAVNHALFMGCTRAGRNAARNRQRPLHRKGAVLQGLVQVRPFDGFHSDRGRTILGLVESVAWGGLIKAQT